MGFWPEVLCDKCLLKVIGEPVHGQRVMTILEQCHAVLTAFASSLTFPGHVYRSNAAITWSSYQANAGPTSGAPWLGTQELWGCLLGHDVASELDQARAQRLYVELVADGQGVAMWEEGLNRQIYLGGD